MAFGSKIKSLWEKGKNFIRKAAPTVQKVVDFVGGHGADMVQKIGDATGIKTIQNIAPILRKGAETISKGLDIAQNGWRGKPKDSFKEINYADNPPAPI